MNYELVNDYEIVDITIAKLFVAIEDDLVLYVKRIELIWRIELRCYPLAFQFTFFVLSTSWRFQCQFECEKAVRKKNNFVHPLQKMCCSERDVF